MDSYLWLTKAILNYYEDLIVLAKYIYLNPKSSTTCKKYASHLVLEYISKDDWKNYVENLQKMTEKL